MTSGLINSRRVGWRTTREALLEQQAAVTVERQRRLPIGQAPQRRSDQGRSPALAETGPGLPDRKSTTSVRVASKAASTCSSRLSWATHAVARETAGRSSLLICSVWARRNDPRRQGLAPGHSGHDLLLGAASQVPGIDAPGLSQGRHGGRR